MWRGWLNKPNRASLGLSIPCYQRFLGLLVIQERIHLEYMEPSGVECLPDVHKAGVQSQHPVKQMRWDTLEIPAPRRSRQED